MKGKYYFVLCVHFLILIISKLSYALMELEKSVVFFFSTSMKNIFSANKIDRIENFKDEKNEKRLKHICSSEEK